MMPITPMDNSNINIKAVVINLVFIVLFLFVPTDKALFIISLLHLTLMLLSTSSLTEALVYLFWPWWVFEAGRMFSAILVPFEVISSPNYSSSVITFFLFSPLFILSSMLVVTTTMHLWKIITVLKKKYLLVFCFLFLYVGMRLFSAFQTEYNVLHSVMYAFREAWIPLWLFNVLVLKDKKKVFSVLLCTLVTLLCVDLCIAAIQFFLGTYIGIHAERAHYIVSFGQGSDEQKGAIRVSGLWSHPNGLADWLTQLGFAIVCAASYLYPRYRRVAILSFQFLLFCIAALTLNRVMFIPIILLFFLTFSDWWEVKKFFHRWFSRNSAWRIPVLILLLLCIGIGSVRISQRVYYSLFSFNKNGGITTRAEQFKEAFLLVNKRPLLGSGPGMYLAGLLQWVPNGQIKYFPESVHNGFLLIAAESGVLSLVVAVFIQILLLILIFRSRSRSILVIWWMYNILVMTLHKVDTNVMTIASAMLIISIVLLEPTTEKKAHEKVC